MSFEEGTAKRRDLIYIHLSSASSSEKHKEFGIKPEGCVCLYRHPSADLLMPQAVQNVLLQQRALSAEHFHPF
jgi:hypothetical protein